MNKMELLSLAIQDLNAKQNDRSKENIRELVNDLIVNDFNQLVRFLYRVDVNENKLKKLLHDNPETDAAVLITDLIIQRELEKLKAKESFKQGTDIPDEEKW
jgi:hypothetical protein